MEMKSGAAVREFSRAAGSFEFWGLGVGGLGEGEMNRVVYPPLSSSDPFHTSPSWPSPTTMADENDIVVPSTVVE